MSIRTLLAAGIIGWAASASASSAFACGYGPASPDAQFVLENASSQPIATVWVSPIGQGNWCGDLLRGRVLAPGQSITITPGGKTCRFDVRVGYQDGSHEALRNIDLCQTARLRFTKAGGAP